MGGVIFTPPAVTAKSSRGMLTLNTPSLSLIFPLAPASCSILAVSNVTSAASVAIGRQKAISTGTTIVRPRFFFMLAPEGDQPSVTLQGKSVNHQSDHFGPSHSHIPIAIEA